MLAFAPEFHKHDPDRPQPPRVEPAANCCVEGAHGPPSDAIILFDGAGLDAWDTPTSWTIESGELICAESGDLVTRRGFGDVQLHLEWSTPDPPEGNIVNRGNSGVFLMSRYELQIFDSYSTWIYADGMAGAVYGETPPLTDPIRPPGEWNCFDIIFHAPAFGEDGEVTRKATITAFFNGVLIHDATVIHGPLGYREILPYEPHGELEALMLQAHGSPVRFRNIWARPLDE